MQQIPTANPWLAAVEPSPIGETKRWVLNRTFPADRPLIDLSQAVPGYPPAMELRKHLGELLLDPTMHGYTPILGVPALRENYAAHLSGFYGAPIAAGEVGITSGCNQAFCLALMSIAKAGDQVILPRPHYFNHDMWMRMQGIEPVSLDFRPGSGAVPNAEDAAKLIGPKTRAIVLISPNNPTGAVYPRETIHAFYELAQRHELIGQDQLQVVEQAPELVRGKLREGLKVLLPRGCVACVHGGGRREQPVLGAQPNHRLV